MMALYEKGETLKDTLISKFSFGFAGPKLNFKCNLVITNKRLAVVPYPNQKMTKDEMYKTRSLYYHKDIVGAEVSHAAMDTAYEEVIIAYLTVKPAKGVDLRGLFFSVSLNLSREEMAAVAKSMKAQHERKQAANAALQSQTLAFLKTSNLTLSESFKVGMYEEILKKAAKGKGHNPDVSILPMRDFLIWTINQAIADAK
jgi:ABC-type uncharacterized transport system YnjBCD ATPase subunit